MIWNWIDVQLLWGNLLAKEKYGNTELKAKQNVCVSFFFFVLRARQPHTEEELKGCAWGACIYILVEMKWIGISAWFILVGAFEWSPLVSNILCRHNYSKGRMEWTGMIMDIIHFWGGLKSIMQSDQNECTNFNIIYYCTVQCAVIQTSQFTTTLYDWTL